MFVCEFCGEAFESLDELKDHLSEYHRIETDKPERFALIDSEFLATVFSSYFPDGEPYDDIAFELDSEGHITVKLYFLTPCIVSEDMKRDVELDVLKKAYEVLSTIPFGRFAGIKTEKQYSGGEYENCYYVVCLDNVYLTDIV